MIAGQRDCQVTGSVVRDECVRQMSKRLLSNENMTCSTANIPHNTLKPKRTDRQFVYPHSSATTHTKSPAQPLLHRQHGRIHCLCLLPASHSRTFSCTLSAICSKPISVFPLILSQRTSPPILQSQNYGNDDSILPTI